MLLNCENREELIRNVFKYDNTNQIYYLCQEGDLNMKTIVHIDTQSQEGRDLVEYLRTLTDIVYFEESDVNEAQEVYKTEKSLTDKTTSSYVPIEEFRVEAKKRVKDFLDRHGLHK